MLDLAGLHNVVRMLEEQPVTTAPSRRFSYLINQANKDACQDSKSDWLTWVDIEDTDTSLIRHII